MFWHTLVEEQDGAERGACLLLLYNPVMLEGSTTDVSLACTGPWLKKMGPEGPEPCPVPELCPPRLNVRISLSACDKIPVEQMRVLINNYFNANFVASCVNVCVSLHLCCRSVLTAQFGSGAVWLRDSVWARPDWQSAKGAETSVLGTGTHLENSEYVHVPALQCWNKCGRTNLRKDRQLRGTGEVMI